MSVTLTPPEPCWRAHFCNEEAVLGINSTCPIICSFLSLSLAVLLVIMETTQTLRFKTKALAVLSKCYDHAQTHLKGGVLQVNLLSVNYGGPRLAAVANAGTAGLISFEVSPDAVAEWQNHQSPEEAPAAVSFSGHQQHLPNHLLVPQPVAGRGHIGHQGAGVVALGHLIIIFHSELNKFRPGTPLWPLVKLQGSLLHSRAKQLLAQDTGAPVGKVRRLPRCRSGHASKAQAALR